MLDESVLLSWISTWKNVICFLFNLFVFSLWSTQLHIKSHLTFVVAVVFCGDGCSSKEHISFTCCGSFCEYLTFLGKIRKSLLCQMNFNIILISWLSLGKSGNHRLQLTASLVVYLQGMKLLPTGRKSSLAIFMYSSIVSINLSKFQSFSCISSVSSQWWITYLYM